HTPEFAIHLSLFCPTNASVCPHKLLRVLVLFLQFRCSSCLVAASSGRKATAALVKWASDGEKVIHMSRICGTRRALEKPARDPHKRDSRPLAPGWTAFHASQPKDSKRL